MKIKTYRCHILTGKLKQSWPRKRHTMIEKGDPIYVSAPTRSDAVTHVEQEHLTSAEVAAYKRGREVVRITATPISELEVMRIAAEKGQTKRLL